MSIKDFQVISKLGEGAYSNVYKVRRISDDQEYALKRVKLGGLSDKEKENALNEVRILASIHSPYIIGYKEVFFDENAMALCIVMEYAEGGDLFTKLHHHQKAKTYMKEQEIWNISVQMIQGLKALHDLKILHRDLKSANVFLLKDGEGVKLGDLNVSKITKNNLAYTQTGTPYYASPEIWRDQPYNVKSDIWSLGCVIYEMCTWKPPFRGKDLEGLYQKIKKGSFEPIPAQYSIDLANLISMCLQVSSSARPTCDQLLKFPIIQKQFPELVQVSNQKSHINELLNTIRIPKNIKLLSKQLPKPKYLRKGINLVNVSADEVCEASEGEQDARKLHVKKLISQSISFSGDPSEISKVNPREKKNFQLEITPLVNDETNKDRLPSMEKDYVRKTKLPKAKEPEKLPDLQKRPKFDHKIANICNILQAYDPNSRSHEVGQLASIIESKSNHNHRSKMNLKKIVTAKRSHKDLSVPPRNVNASCIEEIGFIDKGLDVEIRENIQKSIINEVASKYRDYQFNRNSKLLNQKNLIKVPSEDINLLNKKADNLLKKYQAREVTLSHKDLYASELYPQKLETKNEYKNSSGSESEEILNKYKRLSTLKKKINRFASNGRSRDISPIPYKLTELSHQYSMVQIDNR